MDIEEYEPKSALKVEEHHPTKAKFPFIDVHNHQFTMPVQDLDKLVNEMDELNMAVMVNLSGFRGKFLEWSLENVNENYPEIALCFSLTSILNSSISFTSLSKSCTGMVN